jgi:hypothetical protein
MLLHHAEQRSAASADRHQDAMLLYGDAIHKQTP